MTRPNRDDLAQIVGTGRQRMVHAALGQEAFGGMRHIPAEHRRLVGLYRQRKKIWTMERLPSMPADQWEQFMAWVSAFGKV